MNTLIVKLGATGDVVRTTPLLRRLPGKIIWITARNNLPLLEGLTDNLKCLSWDQRHLLPDVKDDLVINLEDDIETSLFLRMLKFDQLFGAYADQDNVLHYTDDAAPWFDLSLISKFGRQEADRLKFLNRRTYQDLIFDGLGFGFDKDKYLLPRPVETGLFGDVAICPEAGPVWPNKNWPHYNALKQELEFRGFRVNVLPRRTSLLEHLADVQNHRCLVSGDSLPMHLALGTGVPCITLFTCTSPWEIHDYGIQTKLVSPLLGEFFYQRYYNPRATTAINVDEVLNAVLARLRLTTPVRALVQS